jgi:YfiH family protein
VPSTVDRSIEPDWPAIPGVRALATTRAAGNLALHTGDVEADVLMRRAALRSYCDVDAIVWLDQVHGTAVVCADDLGRGAPAPIADAVWTRKPRIACAVLTADCVPIVVADVAGDIVGIAHGGWRGLAGGVIDALLDALPVPRSRLVAWLGPAISPARYEVGDDVAKAIEAHVGATVAGHVLGRRSEPSKYLADLPRLAAERLDALGVQSVVRSELCTFDDARFYSYRRDKSTGRIATLVWRT